MKKDITTDLFTFEELINSGGLYVDKTRYVWSLVSGAARTFFLSRPRRFGKSLLLSTLKAYFEGKKELFAGLEIEKLKTDEWETYPVIHLDLASGSSRESFEVMIRNWKQQFYKSYEDLGVEPVEGSPAVMLDVLIDKVYRKYDKQVVILIDEYDKPILDSMNEPYLGEVMKTMSDFYQKLKSANDIERFVFITGVTKFAHVSLFSGSNNPTDLTRDENYATMLGYTEQELQSNFSEHIDAVAERRGKSREEILDGMKLWYNGMRFVSETESVYNPVSVGCFFNRKRFDNYWIATGMPRVLLEKVKNTPFRLREFSNKWMPDTESDKYELDKVSAEEMAIQTGYLSIAEWRECEDDTLEVRYSFPNKEVRDAWYLNIASMTSNLIDSELKPMIISMREALNDGNLKELMDIVSNFFSGIPYENAGEITEGYFRNQLHTLFTLFGIPNQCEVQQASKRVDIVAQTRKMAVVFEAKMLPKEDSGKDEKVEDLLKAAIRQAKENGYAEKYRNESEIVKTIGIVFDEKTRKVAKWEEAK